jgi:hypothetical protein
MASQPDYLKNQINQLPDQYSQYDDLASNPLDFYTGNGEFNIQKFNKVFRDQQKSRTTYYDELEKQRLDKLKQIKDEKKLDQYTIGEHFIKMKDSFLGIIEDLQKEETPDNILTKDNRLFYVGLLFLTFFLLYIMMRFLINEK